MVDRGLKIQNPIDEDCVEVLRDNFKEERQLIPEVDCLVINVYTKKANRISYK